MQRPYQDSDHNLRRNQGSNAELTEPPRSSQNVNLNLVKIICFSEGMKKNLREGCLILGEIPQVGK